MSPPLPARLAELLAPHGLVTRGGFNPDAGDGVPPGPRGEPAGTLVLIGTVGGRHWSAFQCARPHLPADHPLDAWSRQTILAIGVSLGGWPLFPFGGPPHHPFQRWARRAEALEPSPLGILIHTVHGLWHAYRGALAFAERQPLPPPVVAPAPCATCADRPCLAACPVGAFDGKGYDVAACAGHLATPEGAPCMTGGCLARRACPVGREFAYGPDQAAFHMAAFLAARRSA